MKPFTESMRYEYPLSSESLVLEIGCYKGAFAKTIAEKYRCRVLTFEPIKRFFDEAVVNIALSEVAGLVRVENVGIGATTRKETLRIHGELSGVCADGEPEEVQIVAIDEVLRHEWAKNQIINLLSINCENSEYEILESMLDHGLMSLVDNLQVQFHSGIPLVEKRREGIRNRLQITHRPTWELGEFDTGWDGWEIKP